MKNLILFLGVLFSIQAFAQKPGEKGVSAKGTNTAFGGSQGTTYGLIIGISKYQHFPSLKFADNDARAFYDYLMNGLGEKVDSANIRILLNEQARAGDIWRDFGWLTRKANRKGDRVFIYFSGHGDAANAEEAYLLAHDAPNEGDPNLYNAGGTFQIYNLKTKIKQLSEMGVQVVLITDACRTNELPGKESGSLWTFNKIMEKQSGEIQMASCAANEKSLESKNWGNGRGVFSWHLINGMYGLADDDPEDGNVTLYELQKYVKAKVRADTKGSDGIPAQNPMFCCNEMENIALSRPSIQRKNELIASLNTQVNSSNLMAMNINRSVLPDIKKIGLLYGRFLDAISREHLTGNDPQSAKSFYNQLIESSGLTPDAQKEITDEYVAALVNFAQQRVNKYLSGQNQKLYTYEFFIKAADALREAYQLLGPQNDQAKVVMRTRLMLEARASTATVIFKDFHENKSQDEQMKSGLLKLDSAFKLSVSASDAVLYHTYALVLQGLNNIPLAIYYEKEALKIAPVWKYPYNTLGYLYNRLGKSDSALYYYHACILIDPGYTTAYNNLGYMYMNLRQYDKALEYLNKCISLDPDYLNAKVNKGLLFYYQGKVDDAEKTYQEVINADSNFSNAHFNLANLYYNKQEREKAVPHYQRCVKIDPHFAVAHFVLSCIYSSQNKLKESETHFDLALKYGFKDVVKIDQNKDLENFRKTSSFKKIKQRYLPAERGK